MCGLVVQASQTIQARDALARQLVGVRRNWKASEPSQSALVESCYGRMGGRHYTYNGTFATIVQ